MDLPRMLSLDNIFPVTDTIQNFIFIAWVMLYKVIKKKKHFSKDQGYWYSRGG